MALIDDLTVWFPLALSPKQLVLQAEYEAQGSSVSELLKNWKTQLETEEGFNNVATRAAEAIRMRAGQKITTFLLTSEQEAVVARLDTIRSDLERLLREEDSMYRLFDSTNGRKAILPLTVLLPVIYDHIIHRVSASSATLYQADCIKLLRLFFKVMQLVFGQMKKREKDVKLLTKLLLPVETPELLKLTKEAFSTDQQGELFLWKSTGRLKDWLYWWFNGDYDRQLVIYLNQIDPDFQFKLPIKQAKPVYEPAPYGRRQMPPMPAFNWDTRTRAIVEDVGVGEPMRVAAADLVEVPLTPEELAEPERERQARINQLNQELEARRRNTNNIVLNSQRGRRLTGVTANTATVAPPWVTTVRTT